VLHHAVRLYRSIPSLEPHVDFLFLQKLACLLGEAAASGQRFFANVEQKSY
jgi:hypothetical protein